MVVCYETLLLRWFKWLGEEGTDGAALEQQFIEAYSCLCSFLRRGIVYSCTTKCLEIKEGGMKVDLSEKVFQFTLQVLVFEDDLRQVGEDDAVRKFGNVDVAGVVVDGRRSVFDTVVGAVFGGRGLIVEDKAIHLHLLNLHDPFKVPKASSS